MKKVTLFLLVCIAISIALSSCSGCGKPKKNIPDVSKISVDVKIVRYDLEMTKLDTNNIVQGYQQLKTQYPSFTSFFTERILEYQKLPDSIARMQQFRAFVTYPIRSIFDTLQTHYPNVDKIEKELTQACRFYKYYFPKREVPTFYTYMSLYNYGTPVGEDFVGIGLDFFLGKDHKTYYNEDLGLGHAYLLRTLNEQHLTSKVMYAIADDIVGNPVGNRMIDMMIANGKKFYLQDLFLPEAADSVKLGWTQVQVNLCQRDMKGLYQSLNDAGLLLSTDFKKFRKFVELGPFRIESPSEAPGNSGSWLGMQMVAQYAERNPKLSLEQILAETDSQKFLKSFKPR